MRWQKKVFTMARIFLLMLTLVLPWYLSQEDVFGAESEKGSITISLDDLGTVRNGVGFTASYVGNRDNAGNWKLSDSLLGTGVSLENLTYADEWDAAASKLAQAVSKENLTSVTGTTDNDGNLVLEDLDWGMYLVVQNGTSVYGTVSPFLAGIPYVEDGVRKSDLTVHPKAKVPEGRADGRIEVTKRVGYQDAQLLEVIDLTPVDDTYYVGLFQDKEGKIPYGTDYIRTIRMQQITVGTAVYENLPAGTYYVFETDSEGNAYKLNERQNNLFGPWMCKLEDGSSQKVTLTGKKSGQVGHVALYNLLYYDIPDGYFYTGKVNISKEVLEDGNQITTDEKFYVGLFRDEAGTDLYKMAELVQNGTITLDAILGGTEGKDPITYYIYETDADGKRLDQETFAYTISGEDSIDLRKGNLGASVSLVNAKTTEEPEPTATPGPDPTITDTPQNPGNGTTAVKTGDDTPVGFYFAIFAAAFAVILASVGYLRGRKRHEQ